MGYLKETVKGTTWVGGFRFASRGLAFVKLAVIARLLTPTQFGVYGIATLVLALLEIFTETGINTVLIQNKKNIDDYVDTAWIISIVRGFLISFLLFIFSPFISMFFNSPDSRNLIELISLVPLIRGFINPAVVKFQKDLNFHKEFWFKLSVFFIDALVAISVTYLTRNPIGLIWGFVAGAIFELVFSFIFANPMPRLKYEKAKFKFVIAKGKWVTGSGIFQYLFRQGDDIIVGKIFGEASLGIYQAAYKISTLPVSEVADVVSKVTFPVYVKISHDMERLKKAFLKTLIFSTLFSILVGLVVYFFADLVVLVLLGKGWNETIPVLKVLIVFGVAKSFTSVFHSLFYALEHQKIVTKLTAISMLVLAGTIYPFAKWGGLIGVGYSTILASLASLPSTYYYTRKVFKNT